jgi:hypothetical protein
LSLTIAKHSSRLSHQKKEEASKQASKQASKRTELIHAVVGERESLHAAAEEEEEEEEKKKQKFLVLLIACYLSDQLRELPCGGGVLNVVCNVEDLRMLLPNQADAGD